MCYKIEKIMIGQHSLLDTLLYTEWICIKLLPNNTSSWLNIFFKRSNVLLKGLVHLSDPNKMTSELLSLHFRMFLDIQG